MPSDSLRESKLAVTRNRILDALVAMISGQGVHDVSVQKVADRAGVSHRTVYRHFPDKAALLDGLSNYIPAELAGRYARFAATSDLGPVDTMVGAVWDLFEDTAEFTDAYVRFLFGTGVSINARRERTGRIRKALAPLVAHLEPDEAEAITAVFRILGGAGTWLAVRRDHDLSHAQARDTFAWVADLVIRELRAGRGPRSATEGAP